MKKIQLVSDLHLDINTNFSYEKQIKPVGDILIVAGDLCQFKNNSQNVEKDFFSWANDNYEMVIRVPGNHEYYDSMAPIDPYMIQHNNNCVTASDKVIIYDDYAFICSTLWSDIPPQYENMIRQRLNDFHQIKIKDVTSPFSRSKKLTIEYYNALHVKSLKFIRESVIKLRGGNKKMIIVTHHSPTFRTIDKKFKSDRLNYAFASDMDNDLYKFSGHVDAWLYGHSHSFDSSIIEDIKMIRNPVGYAHETPHNNFCDNLIINKK